MLRCGIAWLSLGKRVMGNHDNFYPWDAPDEEDYDWLSLVDLFYEWDGWEQTYG